ncbi:MAG TPA: glycoside hydrolase family 13 protein [Paludibacteraceae bacterium]|nr:glycoside hydrolase family 13 protein [Paludibacteraceae bacterium]HPO68115.1 glycoside hydrolase family 13 protein [Paludibacteraceae bacterium]
MKKFYILFLITMTYLPLAGRQINWIQHLEPAFWWAGMNNPNLQLMIHGTDISHCDFFVDDQDISIERKIVTDNPHYVFLYLNIPKNTQPRKFKLLVKKGKNVQQYEYELKARKENSAQRKGFTSADAIYLIMPDRFCNGNSGNDSVPGYYQGVNRNDPSARHGGDIEGIISKVPYLADLGITAIWTTPLLEDNDQQYSYHHYACSNYYRVDPRFGTNEDYARLGEICHNYGIKLIIDAVPNHCGITHWWMKDIPSKDWFNTWPQYTSTNYRINVWTDPHASKADLLQLTNGWFDRNMPDLNLKNPLVFDYLLQAYVFWLEYAGIDGIRVDTYPYNDIHVASKWLESIKREYPNITIVGECWLKSPAEIAYYQSGNQNKDGFDSHLDCAMDFCLKDVFAFAFNEKESWNSGMNRFYFHFAQDFVYPSPDLIMNFLDNHDTERYETAINGDVAKYKMALAVLMTVRGFPQIYYGTEIMLAGKVGTYEGQRFDFPGGWLDDPHNAFTAEGRTQTENEIFTYLQTLLHYRKNNLVLQSGEMKHFIPENGIYVYFRYNEDKTVMIVANNNEQNSKLSLGRFSEMTSNKKYGKDIVNGKTYPLNAPIEVSAKTVLILELS